VIPTTILPMTRPLSLMNTFWAPSIALCSPRSESSRGDSIGASWTFVQPHLSRNNEYIDKGTERVSYKLV
jgi:hypothetical protein